MNEIYLSELKINQSAKIISINESDKKIKKHLLDMGFTKGTKVTIKKIAPLGDPLDIQIRDYELCICKKELSKIKVEII